MAQARKRLTRITQTRGALRFVYVGKTLGITECLIRKWKQQREQQGEDTFPRTTRARGLS